MKKLAPLLFALVLLTGCSSIFDRGPVAYDSDMESSYGGGYATGAMPEAYPSEKSSFLADTTSYDATITDRKLIKTGDLSLHVSSVNTAVTDITTAVTQEAGMVISSSVNRGDKSYSGYMSVRVPADKFDETMTALKALSLYVVSEDSNASDVTEYYTDLQTRLSNKQAEEAQYLEIMKQANNVTDTLAVTQALNDVQYEIESLQAQIKGYDTQIDYSTINISLSEDESVATTASTWSPNSTAHQAQSDFVVFVQSAVDAVIYVAVFGWPILLLLVVVWAFRRFRSPKSKR